MAVPASGQITMVGIFSEKNEDDYSAMTQEENNISLRGLSSNSHNDSDGGNMTLKSEAFDLQSTNLGIDTSRIFLGTITALDDTSGRGFYVTSSGFYNIQNSDTEYIRNVGSGFELKAQNVDISGSSVLIGAPSFRLGDSTNFISGSGGSLVIQNTIT